MTSKMELITTDELANAIRVSKVQVMALVRAGMPFVNVSNAQNFRKGWRPRFFLPDVIFWLKTRTRRELNTDGARVGSRYDFDDADECAEVSEE